MANAFRGELDVDVPEFEGKPARTVTLRWSINATCEIEDLTGRSFNSIAAELATWMPPTDDKGVPLPETPEQVQARAERIRFSLVRAVLCGMLRERHKGMTLNEAGDIMFALGGVLPTLRVINDAFERGSPETKGARPPQAVAEEKTETRRLNS